MSKLTLLIITILVSHHCISASESQTTRDGQAAESLSGAQAEDCIHLEQTLAFQLSNNRSQVVDLEPSARESLCSDQASSQFADTQKWRFKYITEQLFQAKVRLLDQSIDARLANVHYTLNSARIYSVDSYTFNSGSDQADENAMQQVAGSRVDDEKCGEHLSELLGQVRALDEKLKAKRENASVSMSLSESDIRLAHFLDSFGRYEAGHLWAKSHASGSSEECLNTGLSYGDHHGLSGTNYCWARLKLDKYLDEALRSRRKGPNESDNVILVGACVPESCHSKSFSLRQSKSFDSTNSQQIERNRRLLKELLDTQFSLPQSIYIESSLEMGDVYCVVSEDSQFASSYPLSAKLFFAFIALWLALASYATWKRWTGGEISREEGWKARQDALACLDLRASWADFTLENDSQDQARADQGEQRVQLDTLNPFKVLASWFVAASHAFIIAGANASNIGVAANLANSDPLLLGAIAGTVMVDKFFCLSGLLTAYIVMARSHRATRVHEKDRNDPGARDSRATGEQGETSSGPRRSIARLFFGNWFKFAAARHLRLLPLLLLCFCFKRAVFPHLSASGKPFWDSGFNAATPTGACAQESWLSPILYQSAFLPFSKQCLPQSWTVAADLFMSLFIPPILMIMTRNLRLAAALSASLVAISTWSAYKAVSQVHPSLTQELFDFNIIGIVRLYGNLSYLFTHPFYRFTPFIFGLFAGYFLYEYKRGSIKQWPGWFSGALTKLVILLHLSYFLIVANAPKLIPYVQPYHRNVIPYQLSVLRIVAALCDATTFMRMASDWNRGFLMRQSCRKFWRVLVKLNLAFLLVHMDHLLYLGNSHISNRYFSKLAILSDFSATMIFTIPVSILLHVVFENPVDKLVKRYLLA